MAVTAQGSGTQTAVIGTEHTLLDVAVEGTFVLHVNTLNMANLDVLELRVYQIILTGDTREVAYFGSWSGVQPTDDRLKVSIPSSNELTDAGSLRYTLKQTFGTGRAFKWKVLKHV